MRERSEEGEIGRVTCEIRARRVSQSPSRPSISAERPDSNSPQRQTSSMACQSACRTTSSTVLPFLTSSWTACASLWMPSELERKASSFCEAKQSNEDQWEVAAKSPRTRRYL